MLEYCKCGSLIINGSCTHKGCINNLTNVSAKVKKTRTKSTSSIKAATKVAVNTAVKSPKIPRASKCITYKLSDLPQLDK